MTIGSMILTICLSFLFFYYFPYRALKVLGFIPYFFYKIFILRKLKWKSKAVITHRGWIEYMAKGNQNAVLEDLMERINTGLIAGPRITRSCFIEGESPFSASSG